ncbi:hypothetical protein TDB9533_00005 [Thalassocella blandensis]|nr:hypothetical protein TDB9533_00005 [Thalassocella blandensis]
MHRHQYQHKCQGKLSKKLGLGIASVVLLGVLCSGATYWWITQNPNARNPLVESAASAGSNAVSAGFVCDATAARQLAYEAVVDVSAESNGQSLYASHLKFKLQLQNDENGDSWGVASQISVNEGGPEKYVDDVLFRGTHIFAEKSHQRKQSDGTLQASVMPSFLVYTQFEKLGLMPQHPLTVLSQVLKSLSIGSENESYHYAYDPMQREYKYYHKGKFVERSFVETSSVRTVVGATNQAGVERDYEDQIDEKVHAWVANLGRDCLPDTVYASELANIENADIGFRYRYVISLKRTDNFLDIVSSKFTPQANSQNTWQAQQVAQQDLALPPETQEQMLDTMRTFADKKNAGQLAQAASFMVDHVPTAELVDWLTGAELSDATKRDMIFGLGLSDNPAAEKYMIDTIKQIPAGEKHNEVQQVRLMVALSGHGHSGSESFDFLNSVSQDATQSANLNANALINLGSLANNLGRRGEFDARMQQQLRSTVDQKLVATDKVSQRTSAIYALGNAHLKGYDSILLDKLGSNNTRERYAAGTVVSQNPQMVNQMIDHIQSEPSNLVVTAIINGLQANRLTSEQVAQLHTIANAASEEKRAIIERLLYSGS